MSMLALERPYARTTPGVSEFAQKIVEGFVRLNYDKLQKTITLGQVDEEVLSELETVYEECGEANWDGYGALPVLPRTYAQARRFLNSLQSDSPPTSVGAEPDGHLTLEWYHSRRRTLSVSIDPEGNLYYAVLIGRKRQCGSEPIDARLSTIERLIGEILGA